MAGLIALVSGVESLPAVGLHRNNALNERVWPADFNNDGITDLVASSPYQGQPTNSVVALGRGDGTFGPGNQSQFAAFMSATTFGLAADMNNDGKLDAILGDADADGLGAFVYVVPGKGDLSFDFPAGVALKPGPSPLDAVAADLNGDGLKDLAVASHDGQQVLRLQFSTNGPSGLAGNFDWIAIR